MQNYRRTHSRSKGLLLLLLTDAADRPDHPPADRAVPRPGQLGQPAEQPELDLPHQRDDQPRLNPPAYHLFSGVVPELDLGLVLRAGQRLQGAQLLP